jgi:hypothetical protein
MLVLPLIGMGLYAFYGRKRYFQLVQMAPASRSAGTSVPAATQKTHAFPMVCAVLGTLAATYGPMFIPNSVPAYAGVWSVLVLPVSGYAYASLKHDKIGKIANFCVAVVVLLVGLWYYWWRDFTF